MKKLYFTSLLVLVVAPSFAEPSHTSNSFPSNGMMAEDYTYQNQATVTNLKVSSGTATTTANYANCPPAFPNSDEGATSTDECYTACTVSDFPAGSHIASVTGKNYSGANVTDTCAIASCDTGYHLNPALPDWATAKNYVAERAYITYNGEYYSSGHVPQYVYGITENNSFAGMYTDENIVIGKAACSSRQATNPWHGVYNNPGSQYEPESDNTVAILSDESMSSGATYCYCKIDGYKLNGGSKQNVSSSWLFYYNYNDTTTCANSCVSACRDSLGSESDFKDLLFSLATPSCDANVIQITWEDADQADIDANDAGSVTYGGDIRTPKKAVHKPGKIFTGWTFNIPSGN